MLKKISCLAFPILFLAQVAMAAGYIALEEPKLQASQVVIAVDLHKAGQPGLLMGEENSVYYTEQANRSQLIKDVSGRISALAVGDLTGGFRNDLAIGTEGTGTLYFYTEKDGVWQRHGQPHYLWDTVTRLAIHDFNHDGWGDVLALTEKGQLQIYLSSEGSLLPFWQSPADQIVVGVEVIELPDQEFPEIVYAFRSGFVGVLAWRDDDFTTLWGNYPWGLVESLVIVPDATSPEWLVVTNQKMLYTWRWRNGEAENSRMFEANELGEQLFYLPQVGLVSMSQTSGISLFELNSNGVTELWQVPGLFGNHAFSYEGELYFRDGSGVYQRLVQANDSWRIFIQDQEVTDRVDTLDNDGLLYLNFHQLAGFINLQKWSSDKWRFAQDEHRIRLYPNGNMLEYGALMIPMQTPVLEAEGYPYVTREIFPILGWNMETDTARQQVIFLQDWGWWF